jgi:hypothetical protein
MKTFGKRRSRTRQENQMLREDFTLIVERNGKDEEHVFTAQPKVSAGDIMNTAMAERNQALAVTALRNIIRKSLVDDDGVPAAWRPDPVEPEDVTAALSPAAVSGDLAWPGDAAEHALARIAGEDDDAEYFLGPDGKYYRMDDIPALDKFQDRGAASSRRRWDFLMDNDEDAVVDMADLQEVVRWMVTTASGRPTAR